MIQTVLILLILLRNDVLVNPFLTDQHFRFILKPKTSDLIISINQPQKMILRDSSPTNPPIEPSGSRLPKNNNNQNQQNVPIIGGIWPRKTSDQDNNEIDTAIDYNWKYGFCQHKVPFEGAQVIRRLKFCGDLLSFSFIDGKVCLIRISTGEILNKFNQHNGLEVTGLDFDGIHLCSGSADGTVCFYTLTYKDPKKFGNYSHKFTQLHNNAITGLKLVMIRNRSPAVTTIRGKNMNNSTNTTLTTTSASSSTSTSSSSSPSSTFPVTVSSAILSPLQEELVYVVSCSLDRKLICIDFNSGKKIYEVPLPGIPLCMDIKNGYIVVGLNDGRVIFYKASTGVQLLFFHTKYAKVRSICLLSSSVLFTGSDDGRITRWDLSGGSSSTYTTSTATTSTTNNNKSSSSSTTTTTPAAPLSEKDMLSSAMTKRPTRLIDYYFLEASIQASAAQSSSNTVKNMNFNNINSNSLSSANNNVVKPKEGNFDNSNGATMVYTDKRHKGSPVVSVQGDGDKVLAAYADGTVTAWETATGEHLFDLKGRTKSISTVQYDKTRLIADGAHSAVVMHDFSPSLTAHNDSNDELLLVLNNYQDIDNEDFDEDGNENNSENGGDSSNNKDGNKQ